MEQSESAKSSEQSPMDILKELNFQPIRTAVRQSIGIVDSARKGLREVFPTKWPRLNKQLLGGLQPGKLYIVAGRPGTGKSAFSNQMLFDILDLAQLHGKKVVVFYWSFEMPGYQQILRSASKETGKDLEALYSVEQRMDDISFRQFCASVNKFNRYPIYFQNRPKTADDIVSSCIRFHKKLPDMQIINLIDHSRLVPDNEIQNEMEKLNKLSKACMFMHSESEEKIINILLSQLNRNIEREDRAANLYQPLLSDLFGGDSVSQDGHVVMMIQRPHDLYGITKPYLGEDPRKLMAVHIEKNRDGRLGMIPYDFDGSKFTITERKKT